MADVAGALIQMHRWRSTDNVYRHIDGRQGKQLALPHMSFFSSTVKFECRLWVRRGVLVRSFFPLTTRSLARNKRVNRIRIVQTFWAIQNWEFKENSYKTLGFSWCNFAKPRSFSLGVNSHKQEAQIYSQSIWFDLTINCYLKLMPPISTPSSSHLTQMPCSTSTKASQIHIKSTAPLVNKNKKHIRNPPCLENKDNQMLFLL